MWLNAEYGGFDLPWMPGLESYEPAVLPLYQLGISDLLDDDSMDDDHDHIRPWVFRSHNRHALISRFALRSVRCICCYCMGQDE